MEPTRTYLLVHAVCRICIESAKDPFVAVAVSSCSDGASPFLLSHLSIVISLLGHTESTFDFCRLAGVTPVGVLAELVLPLVGAHFSDFLQTALLFQNSFTVVASSTTF